MGKALNIAEDARRVATRINAEIVRFKTRHGFPPKIVIGDDGKAEVRVSFDFSTSGEGLDTPGGGE